MSEGTPLSKFLSWKHYAAIATGGMLGAMVGVMFLSPPATVPLAAASGGSLGVLGAYATYKSWNKKKRSF